MTREAHWAALASSWTEFQALLICQRQNLLSAWKTQKQLEHSG